jgi:CRISPR-associated protein Cas1
MKRLLNTLYINRQKSYLHKERDTIVVKLGAEKLGQFPAIAIGHIFCFGQVSVSPFLMGHCGEKDIGLTFYTEYGKFLARVQGRQSGNVLLRRKQYRWADDDEKTLAMVRITIAAKVANSRAILMRENRNHGENEVLKQAAEHFATSIRRVKHAKNIDEARGMEGDAASVYFGVFNELIRTNGFIFNGRVRRPPTDPVNALLSFGYSLVTQECASALQGVGLDPYVGFLHRDRPGRVSLALDMLEEFRSAWVDRFMLTLINRKQINIKDFVTEASGAVRLTEEARKTLLTAYQERKQVEIIHPYLEEKIPIGLLPHCQAMLMARHIRGDTEYYPPYLLK